MGVLWGFREGYNGIAQATHADRQIEKEIDMFIKIVRLDDGWETMVECERYQLAEFDDGPHIGFGENITNWISIRDHKVYVMNNDGKTIDTYRYKHDECIDKTT